MAGDPQLEHPEDHATPPAPHLALEIGLFLALLTIASVLGALSLYAAYHAP